MTTNRWERLPLVEVVWLDATLRAEDEGDLDNPSTASKFGGLSLCSDIGYLISKNRHCVKLAMSVTRSDDTYRHSDTIPRAWVREIIYLSRPSRPVLEASNEENRQEIAQSGQKRPENH